MISVPVIPSVPVEESLRDSDEDGMPDIYEKEIGLNFQKDDRFDDLDSDSFPNIVEYHHNTNSRSADSVPTPDWILQNPEDLPPNASSIYRTNLFDALDAATTKATPYQVIQIEPGIYKGSKNLESYGPLIFRIKIPVMLWAKGGPHDVIFDGEREILATDSGDPIWSTVEDGMFTNPVIVGYRPWLVDSPMRNLHKGSYMRRSSGFTSSAPLIVSGITYQNGEGSLSATGGKVENCRFINQYSTPFVQSHHSVGGFDQIIHCTFKNNLTFHPSSRVGNSPNYYDEDLDYYHIANNSTPGFYLPGFYNSFFKKIVTPILVQNSIFDIPSTSGIGLGRFEQGWFGSYGYCRSYAILQNCALSTPIDFQCIQRDNIVSSDLKVAGRGYLLSDSPCRKAGRANSLIKDLKGADRTTSPNPDLGAVEFSDNDGDQLDDSWEKDYFPSLVSLSGTEDNDGDGLTNLEEFKKGTHPVSADIDNDGLKDAEEILHGSDPYCPDDDFDGMPDGYEIENGLDPYIFDQYEDLDRDGYPNIFEYTHESKSNDSTSTPRPDIAVGFVRSQHTSSQHFSTLDSAFNEVNLSKKRYQIILLKSQKYDFNGNTNLKTDAEDLLVLSEPGKSNAILDGRGENETFGIESSNNVATFKNITITGMKGTSHYEKGTFLLTVWFVYPDPGSGIRLINGIHRLDNCVITQNESMTGAAGLLVSNNRNLVLSQCTILNNSTVYRPDYGTERGIIPGLFGPFWMTQWEATSDFFISKRENYYQAASYNTLLGIGDLGSFNVKSNTLQDTLHPSSWIDATGHSTQKIPALYPLPEGDSSAKAFFGSWDMDGQLRDNAPEIGADEFQSGSTILPPVYFDGSIPDPNDPNNPDGLNYENPSISDWDEDRLTNQEELLLGLNPHSKDSDGDSLTDSDEINIYHTDPLKWDTDGDGASDWLELTDFGDDE